MQARLLIVLAQFAAAAAVTPLPAHAQGTSGISSPTARVIVKLKTQSALLRQQALTVAATRTLRAQALGQRLGIGLTAGAALSEHAQVVFANGITSGELAQRIARESDVEYAVPDERRRAFAAPNDPLYGAGVPGDGPAAGQWYLRAPGGAVQASIDVEPAWAITTGSPNVVVAVIDTGVRDDHPDLLPISMGGNLLPGYDMISDPALGNDGSSRDGDASDPGDWVTESETNDASNPFYECTTKDSSTGRYVAQDSSWHGTQVSGLIAALTNNGVGMASVGRNVRVLPVRALGKCGEGFDSDILAGLRWAAGLAVPGLPMTPTPARVINTSFGGDGACPVSYRDAVAEVNAAGAIVVASAGNSTGHAVSAPANCSGVIAVAALRHVGTKVGFSDLGPEVAISAPGGNCVNSGAGSPCVYPILTTTDAGTTTPVGPTYTDSFNPTLGTSFSAPLVSGTVALMLSAQPSLTPAQVRNLLQASARPFPNTGGGAGDGTPVPVCAAPSLPGGNQIDQLECYCTTTTCGAGMLDAGAAVRAASGRAEPAALNAQGLWWNAPANSESGWGINFAHQGDVIFATWFTYDLTGKGRWLAMTANKTGENVYGGTLYETRGPAFSASSFNPSLVTPSAVGSATIALTDANNATWSYTVDGIAQTKAITRQAFGPLPTCTWGTEPNPARATNYQDLWWNAPANSESGWGINLTHQGSVIFATWFTYDTDGTPMWLVMTANAVTPFAYSGTLYRTTGPAFNSVPFDSSAVRSTAVGTGTLTFSDGNTGTFAYTVNGIARTKPITRQVFRAPGTVCR